MVSQPGQGTDFSSLLASQPGQGIDFSSLLASQPGQGIDFSSLLVAALLQYDHGLLQGLDAVLMLATKRHQLLLVPKCQDRSEMAHVLQLLLVLQSHALGLALKVLQPVLKIGMGPDPLHQA